MCSCIKYQRSTIYYCFYFSLFSVVVLIPFSIATYEPMTTIQMVYLLGAGLSAAVGQIGITLAYSFAPQKIFLSLRMLQSFSRLYSDLFYSVKHLISMPLSVMSLLLVQAIICSKRHDDKPL